MGEIIFESANLRATLVAGEDRSLLFVTFSSYDHRRTLDRAGFGGAYLQADGIAAIHVTARTNRWFQYRELPRLLAAIRARASGYGRVISYGLSMGGFAALTYGADCGASIGLAFSPQASLRRSIVPSETRWRKSAWRILRWHSPERQLDRQVIAYDPRHPIDADHVAVLGRRAPTTTVPVLHGGHPVAAALLHAGLLKRLVRDVLDDRLDVADYARILKATRRTNPQYLLTIARRLRPHHAATRLRLAERIVELEPAMHALVFKAQCLGDMGRHDEAEATYRTALTLEGDRRPAICAFVGHLERRGAYAEAGRLIADTRQSLSRSWRMRRMARQLTGRRFPVAPLRV